MLTASGQSRSELEASWPIKAAGVSDRINRISNFLLAFRMEIFSTAICDWLTMTYGRHAILIYNSKSS